MNVWVSLTSAPAIVARGAGSGPPMDFSGLVDSARLLLCIRLRAHRLFSICRWMPSAEDKRQGHT